jgi:hypothetical protein
MRYGGMPTTIRRWFSDDFARVAFTEKGSPAWRLPTSGAGKWCSNNRFPSLALIITIQWTVLKLVWLISLRFESGIVFASACWHLPAFYARRMADICLRGRIYLSRLSKFWGPPHSTPTEAGDNHDMADRAL